MRSEVVWPHSRHSMSLRWKVKACLLIVVDCSTNITNRSLPESNQLFTLWRKMRGCQKKRTTGSCKVQDNNNPQPLRYPIDWKTVQYPVYIENIVTRSHWGNNKPWHYLESICWTTMTPWFSAAEFCCRNARVTAEPLVQRGSADLQLRKPTLSISLSRF